MTMNPIARVVHSLTGLGGQPAAAPAGTKSRSWFGLYPGAWNNGKRRVVSNNAIDWNKSVPQFTRVQCMSLSRYLVANHGGCRGMVRIKSRYAVGRGFIAQSQAADENIRKEYEQYFREWAKIADFYGRFNLGQLARLASIAVDVDGDIGFNLVKSSATDWPTLQPILAHRIGGNADNCFDGVVVDSFGRPVSYRVMDDEGNERDIAARDFIHIFNPERADQARGMTALAHAITNMQDAREILTAETIAVKKNSQIAVIMANELGEPDDSAAAALSRPDSTNRPTYHEEESEDGQTLYIRTDGSKVTAHQNNRPSPTFSGHLDYLIRDAAAGLDMSVEFCWDAATLGGVPMRLVINRDQRTFDERGDLIEDKLYRRAWGWAISVGIQSKRLKPSDDWWKVRLQRPAKASVDVGREAAQNRADILLGTRTENLDAAEQGLDDDEQHETVAREATRRIKSAQKIAADTGVSFEVAIAQIRNPNGATAQAATPLSDEPAPPTKKKP